MTDAYKKSRRVLVVYRHLLTRLLTADTLGFGLVSFLGVASFAAQMLSFVLLLQAFSGGQVYASAAGVLIALGVEAEATMVPVVVLAILGLASGFAFQFGSQKLALRTARRAALRELENALLAAGTLARGQAVPDFSSRPERNRIEQPDTQRLTLIHRGIDVFFRVMLLSVPNVFFLPVGAAALVYLDVWLSLSLLALLPVIIILSYVQSVKGLRSRTFLETVAADVSMERREALARITRSHAGEPQAGNIARESVYSANSKAFSKAISNQFGIVFESAFTSSIVTIAALCIVLLQTLTRVPDARVAGDAAIWTDLVLYIVLLRFVFSAMTNVVRATVSVNRVYRHLSYHYELLRLAQERRSAVGARVGTAMGSGPAMRENGRTPSAPLVVGPADPPIDASVIEGIEEAFGRQQDSSWPGSRTHGVRDIRAEPFRIERGGAALVYVRDTLAGMDVGILRSGMRFEGQAHEDALDRKAELLVVPDMEERIGKTMLRDALLLYPDLTLAQVEQLAGELDMTHLLAPIRAVGLEADLEGARAGGFATAHLVLLKLASIRFSPFGLAFVDLGTLGSMDPDGVADVCHRLLGGLSHKITLFVVSHATQNEVVRALGLTSLLFGRTRYLGAMHGTQIHYNVYRSIVSRADPKRVAAVPTARGDDLELLNEL